MPEGEVLTTETVWFLPTADVYSLHPDSYPVLGVILDQHGCSASQDLARSHHCAHYDHSAVRVTC